MNRRAITVLDDQGQRVFAFDPPTDPFHVLRAIAWAYTRKVPLCSSWPGWGCPTTEGAYCCACHEIGWAALATARKLQKEHQDG